MSRYSILSSLLFTKRWVLSLCVLLGTELGGGVGNTDGELLGPLDDVPAHPGGDGVGDGGGVGAVVHHEHLELGDVRDDDGLEAVGVDGAGLLVGTVTDGGHGDGTLEAAADASINTLGLPPGGVADADELVRLMPGELLGSLLDDSLLYEGGGSGHGCEFLTWMEEGKRMNG